MSSTPEQRPDDVVIIEADDVLDALPKTALARFDKVKAILAQLDAKYETYVPDLSTKAGEDEARTNRRELVKIRTTTDKIYDKLNAPLLEAQRGARALKAEIFSTVEKHEKPIDEAIKAKELEREQERQRKVEEEAARIKAIRARITAIGSLPVLAVDMDSANIQAVINDLGNAAFTTERFGEFLDEAEELATQIGHKLSTMRDAATAREVEAQRLADERADFERQRAEQEERDRAAERQRAADAEAERQRVADAAAKLQADADALAAQRAAFQAEQDAVAAKARAIEEAARKKRENEDAEHKAFLKKQQDAFEEERQAALQRQQEELQAVAKQRDELDQQQKAMADAAAKAAAPAPIPEPEPEPAAAEPAQQVAQETFLPPVEDAPEPEPEQSAGNQPFVADFQILDAVANEFNWSLREALGRIQAMDFAELGDVVEASEVPA